MAYEWQPGMKMYEVEWQRDGVSAGRFCSFAMDEADSIRWAEEFFAEHPEHDIPGGRGDTTVCVKLVDREGLPKHDGDVPDA